MTENPCPAQQLQLLAFEQCLYANISTIGLFPSTFKDVISSRQVPDHWIGVPVQATAGRLLSSLLLDASESGAHGGEGAMDKGSLLFEKSSRR